LVPASGPRLQGRFGFELGTCGEIITCAQNQARQERALRVRMLRQCSYGVAIHPTSGCGLNDGAKFVTAGRILFAKVAWQL
jgi:hypothetical protein